VELKYCNNNYYSEWELVQRRVPQGSVLGPLLFNVHINDFPLEINTISEVIMFADDTSILCTTNQLCGAEYHSRGHKLCSHSVDPRILWNPKVHC
jgi:hypothetical protein